MTCKNCYHHNICRIENELCHSNPVEKLCSFFEDESTIMKLPFIAMIEQHLVNGKFVNSNIQNKNGMYAVVYMDKSKWGTPLIDICGKSPYNGEEAEARLKELKENG